MLTYERTDDYVLTLSDAGRQLYAAEQRDLNRDQQRADILAGTTVAGLLSIAGLILMKILENGHV